MFLVETQLSVEEIATQIGYENLSYFYRQFKARCGMTPSNYRKCHKNDTIIKILNRALYQKVWQLRFSDIKPLKVCCITFGYQQSRK